MTTTLRPTGPESRTADGRRSRDYEIRVNSRPVGAVRLLSHADGGGPATGRITELNVQPGERRRGRGTVAALAAEEVLRGWGCARVEASVPLGTRSLDAGGDEETAHAGPHLMASLGYRERSRHMIKELRERPGLPEGTAARALTAGEFDAWWDAGIGGFIDGLLERGHTREEADAKCEATRATQLPDGATTEGVALRVLTHSGADVGSLWVSFRQLPRPDVEAWVFDVEVVEERRGEGHGRALMLVAERECLDVGVRLLGLNVFTDNPRAERLYTSLGYRTVERYFDKTLL
ncbi:MULTISPECIES: GNAT family N-acetyltransferase [unclassified Streptomyces]|uniref:GNAT family N-acetyltransferase n=1 Tax=unclassified Streptomyces TaxID=2593676 RepID=UPI002DD88A08|nr:GNAT family N-acetyltransferase [Streptomyces sp. NBC_01775]WSB80686.1 GNAT family N-acetyltransferase [Streptomyces sp. NBC_01775]WSS39813.1 GNAT family N-acetyltransferase [Streptomyces sp. NBC_01187]